MLNLLSVECVFQTAWAGLMKIGCILLTGVFLDSVDRFKLDSENQSVQSKATMKPLLEGEDDEMPDTSTGP